MQSLLWRQKRLRSVPQRRRQQQQRQLPRRRRPRQLSVLPWRRRPVWRPQKWEVPPPPGPAADVAIEAGGVELAQHMAEVEEALLEAKKWEVAEPTVGARIGAAIDRWAWQAGQLVAAIRAAPGQLAAAVQQQDARTWVAIAGATAAVALTTAGLLLRKRLAAQAAAKPELEPEVCTGPLWWPLGVCAASCASPTHPASLTPALPCSRHRPPSVAAAALVAAVPSVLWLWSSRSWKRSCRPPAAPPAARRRGRPPPPPATARRRAATGRRAACLAAFCAALRRREPWAPRHGC